MRGCHEDDCHSRKGRLWRSRIRVRKAWAGGGGGHMVQTEQDHTQGI